MEDEDMDPELRMAIAMSLQEDRSHSNPKHNSNADMNITVDLTDESPKATNTAPAKSATSKTQASDLQPQPSLFVSNRKQMEAERLARLNARNGGMKRTVDGGLTGDSSTHTIEDVTVSDEGDSRASKRRRVISPPASRKGLKPTVQVISNDLDEIKVVAASIPNKKTTGSAKAATTSEIVDLSSPPRSPIRPRSSDSNVISSSQTSIASSQSTGIQYPHGVVKRTWAFKHNRNNDIKIEEVFQKTTLRTAILSSFQWDWEWASSKLDRPRTKVLMIMQAKEEALKNQMREETQDEPGLQLCFPDMKGQINCMHSKLMLLFHPTHLRVVVPSANLVPYDWGESKPAGMMENSVFLIDLPRIKDKQTEDDLTGFGQELLYFLNKKGVEEKFRQGVLKFDFTHTSRFEFVHTVGGTHFGEDALRTGYVGLNKAVRHLGLRTDDSLNIDFVTSSIGSLNNDFLSNIYRAAQGEKVAKNGKDGTAKLKDKFRVFFPTHATVEASTGGPGNAGTVCLQKKWWDAPTLPRHLFHDHRSVRPGLLSHNKIIFARGLGKHDKPGKPVAWAYVGSANLSESAWGKMVMDRARKEPKLNCRNWESGVLIPVPDEKIAIDQPVDVDERDSGDLDEVDEKEKMVATLPTMGVFSGVVDLPMEWPSEPIGNKRPWYFME